MTKAKVMIVDDEVDFAAFVDDACQRMGYETLVCHASSEAKEQLASFRPDIIVLDIVMPQEDGFDFLRWLQGRQEAQGRRLILATGFNPRYAEMASVLGDAAGLDVAAVLTKPVRLATLQEAISGNGATGAAKAQA